jgi:hypothetical protein
VVVETNRLHPVSSEHANIKRLKSSGSNTTSIPAGNILIDLQNFTSNIVKGVSVQLSGKSETTIISAYGLLKELAVVVPESLSTTMDLVIIVLMIGSYTFRTNLVNF